MPDLGRMLIFAGGALLLVGILLVALGSVLPLGRLPGDFTWQRGGTRVSVPLATSILLSLVLTVLANIVLRLLNR